MRSFSGSRLSRLTRPAFWLAILLISLLTLLPGDALPARWPRARWPLLVGGLAALGGMIEILQALPAIGRDADAADWVADLAGVGAALLLRLLGRLRR